jgi:histidine triad (HIT) family protein
MNECIFCRIVKGQLEASIIYQNEHTMAFMNRRQGNPGHVLVIPKPHVETIDELDLNLTTELFCTVVLLAKTLRRTFRPDGLNIWQSNGVAAGQEISHIHIHLLPRQVNDNLLQFYNQMPSIETREYLDELAEHIRLQLK